MKYHIGIKIAAFLLAALMLLATFGSTLSIIFLSVNNLYTQNLDQLASAQLHDQASGMANMILSRYAAVKLGNLTREQLSYAGKDYLDQTISNWYGLGYGTWDYWITDLEGNLMENGVRFSSDDTLTSLCYRLNCNYPVHATVEQSLELEKTNNWNYRDYYYTETEEHFLYYYTSPDYYVYLRFLPEATQTYSRVFSGLMDFLYGARYHMIAVLAVGIILFVAAMCYLCFAAGRTPSDPTPGLRGLNRLPLDLVLAICGFGAGALSVGAVVLASDRFFNTYTPSVSLPAVALFAVMLFAASLLVVTLFYIAAAQFKRKDGTWWRRSVIGFLLRNLWKFLRFCFRGLRALLRLLPLTWQWLLTAAAMVLLPLFCLFLASQPYYPIRYLFALWFVGACIADVAMVCYGAYAFGTLMKGAKAMAAGDLQTKVPTKYLFGTFRDFADRLNTLADAVKVAANKQMQSERMKTELITNVSHDIKTPLTSLINYVDLLQAPHTPEEGQQYLEVLGRQSERMKKLIDDLMDMSKASSGNLPVQITTLDMTETLTQALGEFSDKLAAAKLTPVFNPAGPVLVQADGRHTWRVLSNLLSNVVKYALPGTRVYLDMTVLGGCVQVSVKNISAEPLNVSAEELTERFVRGDASRNTEGSGLGLNIAQSLMELQHGTLTLLIDGDLFKVTLTFPGTLNNG